MERVGRKYTIRVHGSGRVITRNRKFLKAVNLDQDENLHLPLSDDIHANQESIGPPSTSIKLSPSCTENQHQPSVTTDANPEQGFVESQRRPRRMLTNLLPHNKPGLKE